MRSTVAVTVILLTAACASHPVDNTPHQVKVTASNIVEVQKAGYIIKERNGEKLYCTREAKTGSHIEKTTTCLTEREWQQIHEESVRGVQAVATQMPPPSGH
jgi:hypothetical protein